MIIYSNLIQKKDEQEEVDFDNATSVIDAAVPHFYAKAHNNQWTDIFFDDSNKMECQTFGNPIIQHSLQKQTYYLPTYKTQNERNWIVTEGIFTTHTP